ncbi:MAG: choice-of-anchor J domain-containing protein [Bacteroidales bacterium]
MKNFNQYIAALSLLAMVSCDPMKDVFDELDKNKMPINSTIEYTLKTADYESISKEALASAKTAQDSALALSIKSQQAFNDRFMPADFVPALITKLYPHLGFTSKAMVTYNATEKISQNVLKLQNLPTHVLALADYQGVSGATSDMNFLTPLQPADATLPKIMETKFASITKDSVVHIQYNYITSDPVKEVTNVTLLNKDFEDGVDKSDVISGWENIAETGTKKWLNRVYSGNFYGEMSAYATTAPQKTWLISPDVVIAAGTAPKLGFDVKVRFFTHAGLKVKISADYSNNPATATWDDVTASMGIPEANQDPFIASTPLSLAQYAGKTINVAFVYEGDGATGKTTTYQIDNLVISETKTAYINPVIVKDVLMERYSGKWSIYKYGTAVSPSDYASMGATSSFRDQATANTLLPAFMKQSYPYAKESDIRTVVYKVGTNPVASEYMFTNGAFVLNDFIGTKTEQYVRNESMWIFDPSVTFDVSNADYITIVNWVKANKTPYMDPKYDNSEYYFGGSYKYNNFNHTPAKLTTSDDLGDKEFVGKDMATVMKTRMIQCFSEVLLPVKYPEATPMNGLDTYFTARYIVYDGANTTFTMKFKLVAKGKFEYVEGPVKQ